MEFDSELVFEFSQEKGGELLNLATVGPILSNKLMIHDRSWYMCVQKINRTPRPFCAWWSDGYCLEMHPLMWVTDLLQKFQTGAKIIVMLRLCRARQAAWLQLILPHFKIFAYLLHVHPTLSTSISKLKFVYCGSAGVLHDKFSQKNIPILPLTFFLLFPSKVGGPSYDIHRIDLQFQFTVAR